MATKNKHENYFDKDELSYYEMNFRFLLKTSHPSEDITRIAKQAIKNKSIEKENYQQQLNTLIQKFRYISNTPNSVEAIQPVLSGWSSNTIIELQTRYGGLLIGLFHFGAHRYILTDLASLSIPVVAPIAGKSYWDYYQLKSLAPEKFSNSIHLLEVEKKRVGRELFSQLRQGTIGGIYVDGNMGPENTSTQDGVVDIQFMNNSISVKSGIARLSHTFGYPVLPIFATSQSSNANTPATVDIGQPVFPLAKNATQKYPEESIKKMMMQLYKQLEIRVKKQPQCWEYALCFHRWLVPSSRKLALSPQNSSSMVERADAIIKGLEQGQTLRKNSQRTMDIWNNAQLCWIDIESQKGIRAPLSSPKLLQHLSSEKGFNFAQLTTHYQTDDDFEAVKINLAILESQGFIQLEN